MNNEIVEYSGMTDVEWGEKAFASHKRIVELIQGIQANFLLLGKEIYENVKFKFYEKMDYETAEDYFASPEIDLSRSWMYALMRMHELYVLKLEISHQELLEIGSKKLNLIASKINDENKDELLADAKMLSFEDLKIKMKGTDGEVKMLPDSLIKPGYYRIVEVEKTVGEPEYVSTVKFKVLKDGMGVILRSD